MTDAQRSKMQMRRRLLGEGARSLRLSRGWTQGELARRCGAAGHPVTRQAVAAWESGRVELPQYAVDVLRDDGDKE